MRPRSVGAVPVRQDDSPHRPLHRPTTAESLCGLYRESCAIVLRHYRRPLTVAVVARALASSPRQVQRAFDEVGGRDVKRFVSPNTAAALGRLRPPSRAMTPPGHGSRVEAREAFGLVAALPPRKRAVLTLQVSGHSYGETAARLGMIERTVERQLLRARAAVRRANADPR
jgi:DNA-binding NarL/FixJ family response regulator